jgi:hypothetical protein
MVGAVAAMMTDAVGMLNAEVGQWHRLNRATRTAWRWAMAAAALNMGVAVWSVGRASGWW